MRYVFCHILVCNAWEGGEKIFYLYRPTFEGPKIGKTTLFSGLSMA